LQETFVILIKLDTITEVAKSSHCSFLRWGVNSV